MYVHVYLDLYILFPCTDLINYNAAEFAECFNFIGLIAFMGSNKISIIVLTASAGKQ